MSEWMASQSVEAQALLSLAMVWCAGFLMTRATKAFGLPNVSGYILAGVAIGPYCLNLLPADVFNAMSFVTDAALALIAFGVGRYMSLTRLRGQGTKIISLTLMESLVAGAAVTAVMLLVFHLPLSFSLLVGAIASATAPASSLMTIRQYRAKGVFVDTLIQVVALDNAVSLMAFSVCAAVAAQSEANGASWMNMLRPLAVNIGVLIISYLLGRLLCTVLPGRSSDHRIVITLTVIFLLAGICAAMDISPLLGCMLLGATYINISQDKTLFKQVNRVSPPINMMFFVLSGMRLNINALATAGMIGVVYFAVRIVGKYFGAWAGGKLVHAAPEVQKYLGFALIPQAGVSIGLAVLAQRILPAESGSMLSTIILSSSVLYEMIGPLCAKRALVLSGAIPRTSLLPAPPPETAPSAGAAEQVRAQVRSSEKNAKAVPAAPATQTKPDRAEKKPVGKKEEAARGQAKAKSRETEAAKEEIKGKRDTREKKKTESAEKAEKSSKVEKGEKKSDTKKKAAPPPPAPEPPAAAEAPSPRSRLRSALLHRRNEHQQNTRQS